MRSIRTAKIQGFYILKFSHYERKGHTRSPKRIIEVDLSTVYLTTLKPNQYNKNKKDAVIEVTGYVDLLHTVQSLLSVCRSALINDENQIDFNGIDMFRVLGVVNDLLPISEAEFLDKILKE